jgi:fucose 4-O-acetylase-like acetyltransferase
LLPPRDAAAPMSAQPRLHSLDNLRATMMWLGVVLHVATVHQVFESTSFWRDPQTSLVADVLVAFIHTFRMPAFFIVSGFFASLLVERRGPGGMLAHRALRVGVPLVVFLPILLVVTVALATMYSRPSGTPLSLGWALNVLPAKRGGVRLQTLHLWFLHLLMGFAFATAILCALVARVPEAMRRQAKALLGRVAASSAAFLVLAMPLAVVGRHYPPFGVLQPSADLLPPVAEWIHYGLYFGFGFVLYQCRDRLLRLYQHRAWHNALAGAICIGVMAVISQTELRFPGAIPHVVLFMSLSYNACAWLWSLALIGGFVRYLPAQNRLLKYMAESSYWVYLVHLSVIGIAALMLRDWSVPAEVKMIANVLLTTVLSVASYHLLVRSTAIGVLLNGPRATNERS